MASGEADGLESNPRPDANADTGASQPPKGERRMALPAALAAALVLAVAVASALSIHDDGRAVADVATRSPRSDVVAAVVMPRGSPTPVEAPAAAPPAEATPAAAAPPLDATPATTRELPAPTRAVSTSAPPTATPTPAPVEVADAPPGTRDKRLWPFAVDSIWNMPIGSDADYLPAQIGPASSISIDKEYFAFPSLSDPVVPVYSNGIWGPGRCATDRWQYSIHLPDNWVVGDAGRSDTPNAAAAILDADGRTLKQMNPVSRCEPGGPLTAGWLAPDQDIYGPGIFGGHGGSGLSSIGGSIREGELTGPDAIRHALKVNLWGHRWLSPGDGGYRWPAVTADSSFDDPNSPNRYDGALPELRMGALLAIPRDVNLADLGLKTEAGRKIAWTMQNYGAYVVDDTLWDSHALDVEAGVADEFDSAYGYGVEASRGSWYDDMMTIFAALNVVDNNGPSSVGGGGTPLQPLAPPIGN
jgi:hypothetical protein